MSFGGWEFNIIPADIDETPLQGESPSEYVMRTAVEKAKYVTGVTGEDKIVIAADTTVADGDEILGKPSDVEEAKLMLLRLRNRVHQVFTAVVVTRASDGFEKSTLCKTDVPMRNYSDQEIVEYIDSGDPFDKAGGYAIQHKGFHPVETINGCYANVMGLPICHLGTILLELGHPPLDNITGNCLTEFSYQCALRLMIMEGKS
jgi:MAF protein